MGKRELRLAIEAKLKERRALLTQNANLRHERDRERERVGFLEKVALNPLANRELEYQADEIVKAILDEALKASRVIAAQTMDTGDYEIGISIPSLHIRRRIYRIDFDDIQPMIGADPRDVAPYKRVTYNG